MASRGALLALACALTLPVRAGVVDELKSKAAAMENAAGSPQALTVTVDCQSVAIPENPDHSRPVAGPDQERTSRLGYCSAGVDKQLSIRWTKAPENPADPFPAYVKGVKAALRLERIDLYVSSDLRAWEGSGEPKPFQEECPYYHVAKHERSHAEAFSVITEEECKALAKDLQALVDSGAVPTLAAPLSVALADFEGEKKKVDELFLAAFQVRRASALKRMKEDRLQKDSAEAYCQLYGPCEPWTWGANLDKCQEKSAANP